MTKHKPLIKLVMLLVVLTGSIACSGKETQQTPDRESEIDLSLAERNAERAMNLFVNAKKVWFSQDGTAMSRYYNPFTGNKSDEKASV